MKKKKNVSFFTKQKTNISVALLSSFKITSTERVGISKTNPIKELESTTLSPVAEEEIDPEAEMFAKDDIVSRYDRQTD